MIKHNLKNYIGGWFIGDFYPTIIPSKDFEVSIKRYKKGDYDPKHYHKLSNEITVIVEGNAKMNGVIYEKDDIILIEKNEATDFEAISDCVTCVIKLPSSKNDKYLSN